MVMGFKMSKHMVMAWNQIEVVKWILQLHKAIFTSWSQWNMSLLHRCIFINWGHPQPTFLTSCLMANFTLLIRLAWSTCCWSFIWHVLSSISLTTQMIVAITLLCNYASRISKMSVIPNAFIAWTPPFRIQVVSSHLISNYSTERKLTGFMF